MEAAIAVGVLVVVGAVLVLRAVRPLPQERVGIVERLGRYRRTVEPGLNVIVPFIDQVRTVVDTRNQIASYAPLQCVTADNVTVDLAVRLYYRITDPVRVVYEVSNYVDALENLTLFCARKLLGQMTVEQARAGHHELTGRLQEAVAADARRWGISLARLEITSIEPSGR